MIRAVFFDFYGTLAGWQPSAPEIQRQAAAGEGLSVDADSIDRAYPTANALLDRENARQRLATRTQDERDAFFATYEQTLLATAGHEVPLDVAARIWRRVRDVPKEMGLYPDSLPAVEALRDAGLTLGVISNMGPEIHQRIEDLGLRAYVAVSVSSGEVGVSKPHAPIFEAALVKAGVAASEALHVGDGYESDVLGARNAGIHPLLLLRERSLEPPDGCPTVASLADVLPYLLEHHDLG